MDAENLGYRLQNEIEKLILNEQLHVISSLPEGHEINWQ